MRILHVIPSKNRPEVLSDKTLSWLCLSRHPYLVFVEPQDYEKYKQIVPEDFLVVLNKNNGGLGYVKKFIADFLADKEIELVVKLDDVRSMNGRGSIPSPEIVARDWDNALYHIAQIMKQRPDVAGVGFPYRWVLYHPQLWSAVNARLQTVYVVKKQYFVGDERISTFEDFHNYMYIRSKNKLTLRYGLLGINSDVGTLSGGMQDFNRAKLALAEIDVLREIYPALQFKRVKNKAWGVEPVLKGSFFAVKNL